MKHNFITIAVVVAMLAIITVYNVYVQRPPVIEDQGAEEAAKDIAEGEALAAELAGEAPPEQEKPAGTAPAADPPHTPFPDVYKVRFETSKGDFVAEIHKDWAPLAAERMYLLVKDKFFDGGKFFRVVPGFVVQFGISPDPQKNAKWMFKNLNDEPVKQSNQRGFLTFARGGPNTRSTQMFVNYGNNSNLDTYQGFGFPPFGKIVEGMDVVDSLNSQYGDNPRISQDRIRQEGNAYLDQNFPGLDSIKSATLIEEEAPSETPAAEAPAPASNTEE